MARPDRRARSHPPGPATSLAPSPLLHGPREIPVGTIDHRTAAPHVSLALRLAFEGLPAKQRAAIALHLHYGYSVAETAKFVDAPVDTVRSRIRAGRDLLRHALEDERR
jgi:DNA-directed RNA polymerase specialized sigma24 family protein